MPVKQNYAGRTFGKITLDNPVAGKTGYWKGKCSCGKLVEKRIDNLKRPGDHTCGKCMFLAPVSNASLEERVRRLEAIIAQLKPATQVQSRTEPDKELQFNSSVVSEVSKGTAEPTPEPLASAYFKVSHDGEFWQAHTLGGKFLYWGESEQEASFAARVYLEFTHNTFNRRTITDAELTISEERREKIRHEVIEIL